MNLAGIVVWAILFGASVSFVNGAGLFATTLASPNAPSVTQALSGATCKFYSSGIADCTANTNSPGSTISTAFTFGNYMFGFVKAIPIMLQGALVPGTIAYQWFGGVGAIVNAGLFIVLSLWAWRVVTGRQEPFDPE